jgi:hypothetical protein
MSAIEVGTPSRFDTSAGYGGYEDGIVAQPRSLANATLNAVASAAIVLIAAPLLVVIALGARLRAAVVGEPAE